MDTNMYCIIKLCFKQTKYDSFNIEQDFSFVVVLLESEFHVAQLDLELPYVAEDDFELLILLSAGITEVYHHAPFICY